MGPGEFEFAISMEIDHNGYINIIDIGVHRFQVFTQNGDYLEGTKLDDVSYFAKFLSSVLVNFSECWEP